MGFLKKLFSNRREGWKRSVSDPALGELRLSDEGDWWESTITHRHIKVQFQIGGDGEPSPPLIAHAHNIVSGLPAFALMLEEFIANEAVRQPIAAEEIRQLKLESVYLSRPPHDGMIYFHGPDEFRVWRCDYVNGKPQGLGFDS